MIAPMHMMSPEVSQAIGVGRAVVALESSLLAQGLPWPDNLEVARESEAAVRDAGAVPATIAVIGGRIRVGLDEEELRRVATAGTFHKANRGALAAIVARGLDAATTVSATLWIARAHGIGVLSTGGLGGVHRGAETTFDVSNDLDELARCNGSLVVCSGAKSVLDVPATLNALETRGVAVIGYRTDTLPGFLAVSSGLPLEVRVDEPGEAAAVVRAHRALVLPGAIVLAQPVPADAAIDGTEMEAVLAAALGEVQARGVTGKAVTPFLLERLRLATEGRSLRPNRALIVANASLAAGVAVALVEGTYEPAN
jgi:pseudouridylate synthase